VKISKFFIKTIAHNFLAIMFGPCFKNIKVIQNYVGNCIANEIVAKYDTKVVCPFYDSSLFLFKLYKGTS
jgi:hypothetical protein